MTKGGTVLMIAPDFPPSSLPSSIRSRLFASHLGKFGWKPVVLTVDPAFYDCPVDPANRDLLDCSVEVIQTRAIPASLARRFGFGDIGIRSLWHHWSALKKLVRSRPIDLVFISLPPCVPMLLGRMAFLRFGIPYVLDYQDPWVTDAWWNVPASERPPKWPLAWAMAKLLEPLGVACAAALTGVSLGSTDYAAALEPGLRRAEIPFGAEPAEFEYLRGHPRANVSFDPNDGNVHLVYTGAVIPGMYPALRVLLGAVRKVADRLPEAASRLRVHFVGSSYSAGEALPRALPMATELGVAHLVTESTARVPYLDALQLLLDSSALIILGSGEPHYTPSKIFPYALAARPIFAILHEASSATTVLRQISGIEAHTFGDAGPNSGLTDVLAERLGGLLFKNPVQCSPDPEQLAPFTAEAMTKRLALVFDEVRADRLRGTGWPQH